MTPAPNIVPHSVCLLSFKTRPWLLKDTLPLPWIDGHVEQLQPGVLNVPIHHLEGCIALHILQSIYFKWGDWPEKDSASAQLEDFDKTAIAKKKTPTQM